MDATRRGKIARLPLVVREELNRRLQEGQTGRKILPWLNSLEEVKKILGEDFEGLAVNDQNLSEWRKGGYQDWLRKTDTRFQRMERTKELAQISMRLAEAGGGNLAEGAATILGGSILEVLEYLDDVRQSTEETTDPEKQKERMAMIGSAIENLTLAVSRLRKGDHTREQLRQNEERLKQAAAQLEFEREKFEIAASKKMLDEALRRKAEEIANSNLSNADKIAAMRKVAFADVDALEQSGEVKLPE